MNNNTILQQLRDVHLPPPVSFWPPAIGWIVIMILAIFIFTAIWYFYSKNRKNRKIKKQALSELQQLQAKAKTEKAFVIVGELSSLLRRIALARFTEAYIAGLSGKKWLAYLDQKAESKIFQTEVGQQLLIAPYRRQTVKQLDILFDGVDQWIKRVCK